MIGATDRIGAYPVTSTFHPNDLGATVYGCLGVDPNQVVHDRGGQPRQLNQGKFMHELFGAG